MCSVALIKGESYDRREKSRVRHPEQSDGHCPNAVDSREGRGRFKGNVLLSRIKYTAQVSNGVG